MKGIVLMLACDYKLENVVVLCLEMYNLFWRINSSKSR